MRTNRWKLPTCRESSAEELEQRIQKALRDPNLSHSSQKAVWLYGGLAVAALMVLIVGGWGTLQLWRAHSVESEEVKAILNLGIADHVHCVIDSHIADRTYTPEKMALSLGPGYVGLVSVLENTLPRDFQIPVAHRCSVNGCNYIHIVIKNQTKILSLIITRKGGRAFPPSDQTHDVDVLGMPLHQAHLRNLEVAGFETREHFGFVVSGLDRKENYSIASELAPPVRDFLKNLEL